MLDIGWTEMLVLVVVALFVVGPRDIPRALRVVGRWVGKIKGLAREFQDTVEDAVRESELEDVRKHKCDRCGFFVLNTDQFLHVEWCKDHRMYEKLCIKCIKENK